MPTTFQIISSYTVGSGGIATIDFTSIPSTYTDLKIIISGRTTTSNGGRDYFTFRLNGSSSSYDYTWVAGYDNNLTTTSGASGQSYQNAMTMAANDSGANVFGSADIYIPNYTSSNTKSISADFSSENSSATQWLNGFNAGLWTGTSAINQITLYAGSSGGGTFAQYTRADLYGIKNS